MIEALRQDENDIQCLKDKINELIVEHRALKKQVEEMEEILKQPDVPAPIVYLSGDCSPDAPTGTTSTWPPSAPRGKAEELAEKIKARFPSHFLGVGGDCNNYIDLKKIILDVYPEAP